MINVEVHLEDGSRVMLYDVHPASQETPVELPPGAKSITIWLGTRPL